MAQRKLLYCVDLNEQSMELIRNDLKTLDFNLYDEVHFVHAFLQQAFIDTFYVTYYPAPDNYEEIKQSAIEVLNGLKEEIPSTTEVVSHCIITSDPKTDIANYAKKKSIDVMVIGTRGKFGLDGLFASSFAEFMVRHAPCELKIIRDYK